MDASALASAETWLSSIATAKLVAAALVAIGVAIEFGTEWVARPFEATVKHARELQVAALETATETARSEIAMANAQAAEANRKAEEERLARVKLEASLAPRSLKQAQQQAVADKIFEFKDQPASVGVSAMGAEPEMLSRAIAAALSMGGWKMERARSPISDSWWPGGIMVMSTSHPRSLSAATRLTDALKEQGLFTTTAPMLDVPSFGGQPWTSLAADDPQAWRIFVVIGAKPVEYPGDPPHEGRPTQP